MPFIVESIVTTVAPDGALNVAPMGVEWLASVGAGLGGEPRSAQALAGGVGDAEELVLRPWRDTTTYRNLAATGEAVVNLTDDVRIFASAAISNPLFPTRAAKAVHGQVLEAACSWREVRVEEVEGSPERSRFLARIVHRGFAREFLGFNRARNAVLEAAILATRVAFLPREEILSGYERLQVVVDKTAGAPEREAMALLTAHVRRALGEPGHAGEPEHGGGAGGE